LKSLISYLHLTMQRAQLHQHIINTAGVLFYSQGYQSTGINQIIDRCDIAKATLYSHFKSKEDICIAYLTQRHEQFIASLKTYVDRRKIGKNKLLAIFDYLNDLFRSDDFYGCWDLNILGEISHRQTSLVNLLQKQKKALLLLLGEVVSDNIENLSKAEIEKVSGGIYLLYESAITESYLFKSDWPIYLSKSIAPSFFEHLPLKS